MESSLEWVAMDSPGLALSPAQSKDLSVFGAAVVIAKANWGIGMIAMPFYLHSAGLGAGLLFFLLSSAVAADAAILTHRLRQRLGETCCKNA
ncbi:unnamed protein product [Effrenium voratum]|uniref:Uncharacterized protein n=1 Tax=Effrenium voratum TaxID=2562239 RepID=A0AA36IFC9_9DINO|nr:unnamed protein product [Effrenium voratum]